MTIRRRLDNAERRAAALPPPPSERVPVADRIEELTLRYVAGGFDVWAADYAAGNAEHGLDPMMSAREVWEACERAAAREEAGEPEPTN
jgi:hypothetical protein